MKKRRRWLTVFLVMSILSGWKWKMEFTGRQLEIAGAEPVLKRNDRNKTDLEESVVMLGVG